MFVVFPLQDKYLQKVHFSQHGIPLPDFVQVGNTVILTSGINDKKVMRILILLIFLSKQIDDLTTLEKAGDLFGYPLMIKSKRLAYDGRGNAVAYNKEELPSVVTCMILCRHF